MLRFAAAAALLALTSCSLLLSDDLSGGPTTGGRNDASTDSEGPLGNEGGSTDASDADATTPATPRRPVGPLKVTVVNGTSITATVDGFFQLEYTSARTWKPARLLDLGLTGNPNLAPSLFEPFAATIEGQVVANATDADAGYYQVNDETPVRFTFTTFAHHHLPSGADAKVWARWSIYASGRLFVRTELTNAGTADLALPQGWIHSSFAVDPAKKWNVVEGADKRSATFSLEEPSGLGVAAVMHEVDGNLGTRATTERHWSGDARTLAPTQSLVKVSELQLGVTPEEGAARVADAHAPELGVLTGVIAVDQGYAPAAGAYELRLVEGATLAKMELTPVVARAYPAFEIGDLPEPKSWRLSLDGQTVASSESPVTPLGVARYHTADNRLLFIYLGTIPANAAAEKRTFVFERTL